MSVDEGRLPARAGRAAAAAVARLFSTGGLAFRDLAVAHAASAAGDTLVTLALAGTLFFSVPTAEARGNVALYLGLTVAPFAVIGPLLGALLDRYPTAYRVALVGSSAARAVLVVLMVWQQDTLWLFPLAFGLLVLSRSHGISRNALLPIALDQPVALVAANARLARIGILAGAAFGAAGVAVVRVGGASAGLGMAVMAFIGATVAGRRLPAPPPAPALARGAPRAMLRRLRRLHLPRPVRLAQLATAVVRLLNGFLVFLLAFAFRDSDAALLDFGALLGAAGVGYALATMAAPFLADRLREEPTVVAALAVEAGAAFVAGQWFGLAAAAALAAAAGYAWGTAKFAFDGLLQGSVEGHRRGAAFTRSETLYQLAWVVGALVPTALPLPADVGLVIAGLTALGAQVVYVGHLLAMHAHPAPD